LDELNRRAIANHPSAESSFFEAIAFFAIELVNPTIPPLQRNAINKQTSTKKRVTGRPKYAFLPFPCSSDLLLDLVPATFWFNLAIVDEEEGCKTEIEIASLYDTVVAQKAKP
jgi:hypothetical protein